VCDLFCSQTGEKRYLLMLLCMILFVSRRGENKIDALECDPFCSQTRDKKNFLMLLSVILFVLRPREEKSFDALVCDPFCSQTRRFFFGCSCV